MVEVLINTKLIYFFIIFAAWGTVDLVFKLFKVISRIVEDILEDKRK